MAALAALMRSHLISPSFPVRPAPHHACPQEPADFLALIRDTVVPPKPHVNHVDHVGGTRDWKGFFAALGLEVHGHTRTQCMKAAGGGCLALLPVCAATAVWPPGRLAMARPGRCQPLRQPP